MKLNIKNILQDIIVDKDRTKNVSLVVKYINSIQAENKELKSIKNSMVLIGSDTYEDNFFRETVETYKVIISEQKK